MASCQITISGSSGTVEIRYILAGITNVLTAAPSDPVFIDDSSTDITACNISGDASATSGCLSVNNISLSYWMIDWQLISTYGESLSFDSIWIDWEEFDFDEPVAMNNVSNTLACTINELGNYFFRAISKNYINGAKYIVLQVKGSGYPYIRIRNSDASHYLWINPLPSFDGPLPEGFTTISDFTDCIN